MAEDLLNNKIISPEVLNGYCGGGTVRFCACVHKTVRKQDFYFVLLRTGRYVFRAVYREKNCGRDIDALYPGCYIKAEGTVSKRAGAPYGYEVELTDFDVLSAPCEQPPLPVGDRILDASPEEKIRFRSAVLRHPAERAVFRIEDCICRSFSDFLSERGFTGIHTPKLVPFTSENQKHAFKTDYFGKEAYLTQSPQLYKQTAAAAFERVYEIGPCFRAEKHGSARHLNEFTGLDLEICYTESLSVLLDFLTALLAHITDSVREMCKNETDILGADIPRVHEIPVFTLYEALSVLGKDGTQPDLDPTDERRICAYAKEKYGSEFVYITRFPTKKRPFYMKPCADDEELCESFDILLRGIEIASGGLRIYEPEQLKKSLRIHDIRAEALGEYAEAFSYGMPPHGGAGFGLERFAMQLCGLHNIRQTSLYPRDIHTLL